MTNDLEVAIPTETENTVAEPTQAEVVTDATDGAEKPAEPAKTAEQIEIERLKRELAHKERALTKRDRTQGKLHQEREQLSAELERYRQGQPAQQPAPVNPELRQVVEREALTLADQIAAQREFAAKCNSVAETGKKDFPEFSKSLTALIEEAGPLVLQNGTATPLGEQILESEAPAALIDYLGKHPEIAAELDGLTHARLARKLAAIETEMAAKPKTSTAPKPLEPVSGKAASPLSYSPEMTDAQFNKWFDGQRANRK